MSEIVSEILLYVGALIVASTICVIVRIIIIKGQLKKLKPDLVELQKANEILDKNNDKKPIMQDIVKQYNKYDFETLKKRYPVYVPAIMDIMNQFLPNDEKIYSKENISNIKKLINYQERDAIQCRIAGLFFISLLVKKNFDFKKYRLIVIKNHEIKESRSMKQIDADIIVSGLKVIAKEELSKILNPTKPKY